MNEIYILFLILGTLFIIENKSINLLAYYVGMVILIAILISIYPHYLGISYISYMLVLVQISALTILFGFIIMLYPKNNTKILIKQKNISNKIKNPINNNYCLILLLLKIFFTILIFLIYPELKIFNIIKYFFIKDLGWDISNINNITNIENNTSIFIKKISYLLYSEPSNIFKFMILTIILLFAIICLFFILFPTI